MDSTNDDDSLYFPVKDFAENSPLLIQLGWSNRTLATLIKLGFMAGKRDSSTSIYLTSKRDIIKCLKYRNDHREAFKIDLENVEHQISAFPLSRSRSEMRRNVYKE